MDGPGSRGLLARAQRHRAGVILAPLLPIPHETL